MPDSASQLPPDPPDDGLKDELAERVRRGLPVELPADEQLSAQQLIRLLRRGGLVIDAEGSRGAAPTLVALAR